MQFLASFFTAALAAIFIENTIFTRALGTSRMLMIVKSPKTMLKFGVLLTCITTVSGFLAWAVNLLIRKLSFKYYIEPLVFVLILVFVFVLVSVVLFFLYPQSLQRPSRNTHLYRNTLPCILWPYWSRIAVLEGKGE